MVFSDTPHAVLPKQVRANAKKLTARDILTNLNNRIRVPWVVLTGGNPALHDLTELVQKLHDDGYLVAVETQGSRWRDWMGDVDRLCVSPKPPSSLEPKAGTPDVFLKQALATRANYNKAYDWVFFKVVAFTPEDLTFAAKIRLGWPHAPLYLSAGNDAGPTVGNPDRKDDRDQAEVALDLLERLRWLHSETLMRPLLRERNVFVQAQTHVLMWGNGLGF